jgi:hypothetical protein
MRPVEHFCHCGREASFGYGVSLLNGSPGTWYCAAHRPMPEQPEAPAPAAEPHYYNVLPQDDGRPPRITVPETAKSMKVELTKQEMWSLGHKIRNDYTKMYGHLPPKDLRQKTNDPKGVHCFATYPLSMKTHIEKEIRDMRGQSAKQGSLF